MVLPYAHVNDIDMTLYYEVEGEGEPLILVHGLLGSAADWRRFVPLLAGAYRVIALDLRGHGRTNNPQGRLRNHLLRDDLLGFMRALDLARAAVIGYSLGGTWGWPPASCASAAFGRS